MFWLDLPLLEPHKGDLDPSLPYDGAITLTWQFIAPEYKTDVDVYVWQRHRQPPLQEYAGIFCSSADLPSRMIVALRSTRALDALKKKRFYGKEHKHDFRSLGTGPRSLATEELLTIIAVFLLLVEDTTSFLQESISQIHAMVSLVVRCPTVYRYSQKAEV